MHDYADIAPLFDSPRPLEKVAIARRTLADALARLRGQEDAFNARAAARADRRATLMGLVQQSLQSPKRAQNHDVLVDELDRLDEEERSFLDKLRGDRRLADEEHQRASAPAHAALEWVAEQAADWRAAGQPKGRWLLHVPAAIKGKCSPDRLAELRQELVRVEDQVLDISRRPATADELKQSIDDALVSVSTLGQLALDPLQRRADPFGLLDALTGADVILPSRRSGRVSPSSAILFGLFGTELRQHFHKQIDAADLTGAISSAEQEREMTKLAAKHLSLEREEEAVLCALEAQGVVIARRPDLDPRAFLEVEEL